MPENVSLMTQTTFAMRVQLDERRFLDIAVRGQNLKYDEKTGAILAGDISELAITDGLMISKKVQPQLVHQISNLQITADKIAAVFGLEFWNEPRFVQEAFDKFATLNDNTVISQFSKAKADASGTDLDDRMSGSRFADALSGMAGDDRLAGGKGNDRMDGGKGQDSLFGEQGNDRILDLDGDNLLAGGAGHDQLRAGAGRDILTGGAGRDTMSGGGGDDLLTGGKGSDVFVFSAKDPGLVTITDFGLTDILVNATAGSAEEAYKMFMERAKQDGSTIYYDDGEMRLVLHNAILDKFSEKNFADAAPLLESGFL